MLLVERACAGCCSMDVEWVDDGWIEELLWCPSQCYRRARWRGRIYTLYLRWRWEDPWQFHIAEGDMVAQPGPYIIDFRSGRVGVLKGFDEEGGFILEEVKWRFVTGDLFEEHGLFFRDEELKEAERAAEELFIKWLASKKP